MTQLPQIFHHQLIISVNLIKTSHTHTLIGQVDFSHSNMRAIKDFNFHTQLFADNWNNELKLLFEHS